MTVRRTAITLVVAALLVAACGGDDDGISVTEPIGAPDPGTTYVETTDRAVATSEPSVVKQAVVEIDVVTDELDAAAQRVVDLATGTKIGGFLVSSVVDTSEGYGYGSVVVKVPALHFEQVVSDLNPIGDITRQQLQGDDLTARFVTARSQLVRARARTASLLTRLDKADDAAVRFKLRQALETSRAELRSLEDTTASILDETAFSSIEVALTGIAPPAAARKPAFERAVATAKTILLGIASGAVLAGGVIIPIGILLLVLYLIGAPVVRRLRPRMQG